MSGLLRGIARTAIVAGTATAVSNNVSRRQSNRWAAQEARYDAPTYAAQPAPAPVAPPVAPAPAGSDPITLLTQLADLHAKGLLTDAEFATQKARILG
jgi:Short C-terminal domain